MEFIWLFTSGLSIDLNKNGEYTNIVLKVEDDIPEESCASLLNNLKVSNIIIVKLYSL